MTETKQNANSQQLQQYIEQSNDLEYSFVYIDKSDTSM